MKWLKRIGIGLALFAGLLILLMVTLHFVGAYRLDHAPAVPARPVRTAADESSIERGRHMADITGCTTCHAANLGGIVRDDAGGLYLPNPNLTSGLGGVGGDYTDADWERAIRHGVGKDGRTLIIMPSIGFSHLGDDGLGDLIAYLKSAPPVDNDLGERRIGFPVSLIFGVLAYGEMGVNLIDHEAVGVEPPEASVSAEYGEYLTNLGSCRDCHMANLAGNYGQSQAPRGPNITPGGDLGNWTAEEFATALQTGLLPDGRVISTAIETGMPWPTYANMTEDEVAAIWSYLSSLAPMPDNE